MTIPAANDPEFWGRFRGVAYLREQLLKAQEKEKQTIRDAKDATLARSSAQDDYERSFRELNRYMGDNGISQTDAFLITQEEQPDA